jgi:hypothetical protein
MALIAIHAVIYVATHAAMLAIGIRLGVAVGALEHGVVRGIRVAGCTDTVRIAMIHWEPCVVEGSSQPARSRMTGSACGWEACRNVVWTVRSLVLRFVTAVAIRGDGCVVVIYMAVRAGHRSMGPGQRETRVVVVEGRGSPGRRVVAHLTLLREACRHMIGIVGRLELIQVTAHACRIRDVVVSIRVALAALYSGMCTR